MSLRSLTLLSLLAAAPAHAGDVVVAVTGVEPGLGTVRVAAFASAADLDADRPFQGVQVAATGARVEVGLRGLPPGDYAIAVFQDADADEALTKTFLGIPQERYGFSNGARGVLAPPSFEAMRVRVGDAPLQLEIGIE